MKNNNLKKHNIMKESIKIILLSLVLSLSLSCVAQTTETTLTENADNNYDIQKDVRIKTRDGATISAMVMRKKGGE